MCKRSDPDPLVRLLTDRYKLNILRVPRQEMAVGDLLVRDGRDLRRVGSIRSFFDPPLELPEVEPAALAEYAGQQSSSLSAEVAATPLAGFLAALGATGLSALGAKLKGARDVRVAFRISDATLESMDLVDFGNEINQRVLRQDNGLYREGRAFFAAHAVARASGMTMVFERSGQAAAELTAEVVQLVEAGGAVKVTRESSGSVTVSGGQPLAFGIGVVQLTPDGDLLRLDLPERLRPVRRKATAAEGTADELPNVLFAPADGEVLVDIEDG
jgi:hypothetical protein